MGGVIQGKCRNCDIDIDIDPLRDDKGNFLCDDCKDKEDLLEDMDRAGEEITMLLNAIRFHATLIRRFPTDTQGVVDYNSMKIVELIENATKQPYAEWREQYLKKCPTCKRKWGKDESQL